MHSGLPWWSSGEESSCQCRERRLNPSSRKIPHDTEQLSPCTRTPEPMRHRRSQHSDTPTHHHKEQPLLATTRERRLSAAKSKSIIFQKPLTSAFIQQPFPGIFVCQTLLDCGFREYTVTNLKGFVVEQIGQVHEHIKQKENTFQASSVRAKRQAYLVKS